MTPPLWKKLREALGLPGCTRVKEIPSEDLARFFFENKKAEDCAPGQKPKEVRPC